MKTTKPDQPATELTKREFFAAIALQGMIAGKYAGNDTSDDVEAAVLAADNLIKKLNGEYL